MKQDTRTINTGPIGVIVNLLLLVLLWRALGGDDLAAVMIGVPMVLLALWAAIRLAPTRIPRMSPLAFAAFVPVFLRLSLAGGIDVARRALAREVNLDPALLEYDLRLPEGTPRNVFILLISLLPGTLSARLDEETLTVHVLDQSQDNRAALARLESRVAKVFRIALDGPGEGTA